ncbi:unnamed protein product [Amoebophrya sp. A25]|nr:unnamed protein product [Amoebophrya sp. A25]|eukprot:GSA25T00027137001.1
MSVLSSVCVGMTCTSCYSIARLKHYVPRVTASSRESPAVDIAFRLARLRTFGVHAVATGILAGSLHYVWHERRRQLEGSALDRLKSDKSLMNFEDVAPVLPGMKPIPVEEMGNTEEEILAEETRLLRILEQKDRRKRGALSRPLMNRLTRNGSSTAGVEEGERSDDESESYTFLSTESEIPTKNSCWLSSTFRAGMSWVTSAFCDTCEKDTAIKDESLVEVDSDSIDHLRNPGAHGVRI